MKKTIISVMIFTTIISCGGKKTESKSESSSETSTPKESEVPKGLSYLDSLRQFDNIIERDALELVDVLSIYKENEVKGDNYFKDKLVVIKGHVEKVGKDFSDKVYVTFKGDKYQIESLQCYLTDENQAADLQKGQGIVIVGVCKGKTMNVIMKECEILDKEK